MLADHHTLVDLNAGGNKEHSTILQPIEGVCRGSSIAVGNERSAGPLRYLALIGHVTVKERIHDDGAAGLGEHLAAQADEAAAGNTELQTHAAIAVIMHLRHLPTPRSKSFNDRANKVVGNIDGEVFHWFQYFAIDGFGDNLGPAYHQLKAFTTHHLDEDGELQLSAAENLEAVWAPGLFDANGDVGEQFLIQALAQVAGGDILSFPSCHGRIVDRKLHGNGRLVDHNQRQRSRILKPGDRLSNCDAGNPRDGHDVADLGHLGVGTLQSIERKKLGDLGLEQRSVAFGDVYLFPIAQGSVKYARDGQAPQVVGVIEVGDQDLERPVRIPTGRRNGGDNGFKERLQILSGR